MEMSETNVGGAAGSTKQSTAVSESSHEVSVEKTATGSVEQESSLKRSVEQTIEKSVQQTSSTVQKSIQSSSVMDEKEKSISQQPDVEAADVVKLRSSGEPAIESNATGKTNGCTVEDDDSVHNADGVVVVDVTDDDDGENVQVEQTIVLKKPPPPAEPVKSTEEMPNEVDVCVEITLKAPSAPETPAETPAERKPETVTETTAKSSPTTVEQKSTIENKPSIERESNDEAVKEDGIQIEEIVEEESEEDDEEEVTEEEEIAKEESKPPSKVASPEKVEESQETKQQKQQLVETQTQPTVPKPSSAITAVPVESPTHKQPQSLTEPDTNTTQAQQNRSRIEENLQTFTTDRTTHITQRLEPKTVDVPTQEQQLQQTHQSSLVDGSAPTEIPPASEIRQENIKNSLKEIISDIDRVIELEEKLPTIPSTATLTDRNQDYQPQHNQQRFQPPSQQYQPQSQQYQPQPQQYQPQPQQYQPQSQQYQPQSQQDQPKQLYNQPQYQLQPQYQPQQHLTSYSTERNRETSGYATRNQVIERSEFKDPIGGSTGYRTTTTTTTIKSTPSHVIPSQYKYAPLSAPNINSYISKSCRSMSLPVSNELYGKESTVPSQKSVDLQKIFTPANDGDEIQPQKNRKLYASSAFYSPSLHPTVEDQVELARRISHSLSDISNQQSKGQSMYVNRKKRSVKWVHEGDGQADIQEYNEQSEETKENDYHSMQQSSSRHHEKVPLKLLMNPRGQIQDFSSAPANQGFTTDTGLLSPDKCAELVTALNAPKGKGAELFAKRRKKSEKWIVDETNAATLSPSGVSPYGRPLPASPVLPAYTDLGVQRVQLNMHQDMVQDKYAQPRLKLVKTPWEAAMETGSASAAFEDVNRKQQEQLPSAGPQPSYDHYQSYGKPSYPQTTHSDAPAELQKKFPVSRKPMNVSNSHRDLAYKPSIPQGWGAPPPCLPKANVIEAHSPLSSATTTPFQMSSGSGNHLTAIATASSAHKIEMNSAATLIAATNQRTNIEPNYEIRVENFGQSDEEEIIRYTSRSSLNGTRHDKSVVDCIEKSPELMVGEAKNSFLQLNNTFVRNVEDEKRNMAKSQQPELKSGLPVPFHQQITHQSTPTVSNFMSEIQLRKVTDVVAAANSNDTDESATDSSEEEPYKKIPVRDLINTFEKQTNPIIRQKVFEKTSAQQSFESGRAGYELVEGICSPDAAAAINQFGSISTSCTDHTGYVRFEERDSPPKSSTVNEKGLYTPPEISLDSYVPPPQQELASKPTYREPPYEPQPPIYVDTEAPSQATFPSNYPSASMKPSSRFPVSGPNPIASSYASLSQASSLTPQRYQYNATVANKVKNVSPTPFNPSPLTYEKLAKFEQPTGIPSYPSQPTSSFITPIRKPLAVPKSKVRNTSPTPFGASPIPVNAASTKVTNTHQSSSYQYSSMQQSSNNSYYSPAPTVQQQLQSNNDSYDTQQPQVSQPYHPPPEDLYYNSSAPSMAAAHFTPTVDMSQCQNYNTAPRGWNQMKTYYRPITFSKSAIGRQPPELPYTDF